MKPILNSKISKIVLVDLWTDSNLGDHALQAGLIQLVRDTFTPKELIGIFRFGLNENLKAKQEIAATSILLDKILFSIRPTSYTVGYKNKYIRYIYFMIFNSASWAISFCKILIPIRYLGDNDANLFQALRQADLCIVKGKNYRVTGNIVLQISRHINLCFLGYLALAYNSNCQLVNASIYHSCCSNRIIRALYKHYFTQFKYISVRDKQSFFYLKKIVGCDTSTIIALAPDLSIYYLKSLFSLDSFSLVRKQIYRKPLSLAVILTDWGSSMSLKNVCRLIVDVANNLNASNVYVIPQVTRQSETPTLCASILKSQCQDSGIELIQLPKTEPQNIFNYYLRFDYVLSMRMHGAIFAAIAGCNTFAVEYDEGPKWGTIDNLKLPIKHIPLSKLKSIINIDSIFIENNLDFSKYECNVGLNIFPHFNPTKIT